MSLNRSGLDGLAAKSHRDRLHAEHQTEPHGDEAGHDQRHVRRPRHHPCAGAELTGDVHLRLCSEPRAASR